MKPLSTKDAIQLYKILAIHLPEKADDPLKFIGKIVDSIQEKQRHEDYVMALALMLNTDMQIVLDNVTPEEGLNVFTEGLIVNRIMALRDFCIKLGF